MVFYNEALFVFPGCPTRPIDGQNQRGIIERFLNKTNILAFIINVAVSLIQTANVFHVNPLSKGATRTTTID